MRSDQDIATGTEAIITATKTKKRAQRQGQQRRITRIYAKL